MDHNDRQLIVEALLFSASVQVCANWNDDKQERMVELAKTLGVNPSADIEFWKDDMELEEPWAAQIPEKFEIKQTGIEEDRPYTLEEKIKEQEEKIKEQPEEHPEEED
jgi:hypothetical protein